MTPPLAVSTKTGFLPTPTSGVLSRAGAAIGSWQPENVRKLGLLLLLGLLPLLLESRPAQASDRRLVFSHTTSLAPVGHVELEPSTTLKAGRIDSYRRLDQRLELETGLTPWLQGAFYLNWRTSTELQAGALQSHSEWRGLSLELKTQLLNPELDLVGLGLYLEPTLASDAWGLEFKLLLDKHWGPFLAAVNLVSELEWSLGKQAGPPELGLELTAGLSYDLAEAWSLGLEGWIQNSFDAGKLQSSRLYLGPVVSYRSDGFWLSFALSPQLAAPVHVGATRLDLLHGERVVARLLLGVHL